MSHRGRSLDLPEKEMVIHVKSYFEKELLLQREMPCIEEAVRLTALATGIVERTVWRISSEYNNEGMLSDPLDKGSRPYAVDESVKTICQDTIRSHNILRKHLSIRLLVGILNDEYEILVARETLRRCLLRWKIIHGSVQRYTALRERDYVIKARREYIAKKFIINKNMQHTVYLDESFINKNYSGSDNSWYCCDWKNDPRLDKSFGPYINKPSGKGERLIILNAITKDGWVDGAQLVFQAKLRTGDYHLAMNEENFTKWFQRQLLPNIPDNSVIVMDNAAYHNMFLEDGVPLLTSRKDLLKKWLADNGIEFDENFLRIQLVDLIRRHRPAKIFKLDHMLENDPLYKDRNISILRTPQYHPELQPIEICWGVVKQYMAQHCDFTLDNLRKNLETAWTKVTSETMAGIMEKVTYWENRHFEQDSLLDAIDDEDGTYFINIDDNDFEDF